LIRPSVARAEPAGGRFDLQSLLFILALLFSLVLMPAALAQTQPDAQPAQAGPSYGAMADLLEDPQARNALIEQLRGLAAAPPEQGRAAAARPGVASNPQADSAQGLAGTMQDFAAGLSQDFSETAGLLRDLFSGRGVHGMSAEQWRNRLIGLAAAIAATLIAYALFRALAKYFFRRLDAWVLHAPHGRPSEATPRRGRLGGIAFSRKLGGVVGALLIDAAAIALAALVGYGISLAVHERLQGPPLLALLFVNAFVAVEFVRTLCRAVFSERHAQLRLWPMPDDIALYWSGWLARIIGITGYGLLVVVPLVQQMLTPSIGRLAGLFIMLGVYIYALRVILANRLLLRERLMQRAEHASTAFFATLMRMLARLWHIAAIAYFTALLVVSQADPYEALPFMAQATVQTLIAIGVGALLAGMLGALEARRVTLPDDLRRRLPMLQARVNGYVPGIAKTLRLAILIGVALVVLDAWHAFNLSGWIYSPEGRNFIATLVHVAIVLLLALSAWTLVASLIESRLSEEPGRHGTTERQKTLLSLFRSAALVVIVTMTVLVVLSQIGVNIGPLIAGAGVVGLAIGFGAQKLVQDVITGVFIQLENGMNHNDVVEVAGTFGTVEKITIRSVGIRTMDGGYHLIPFSAIDRVSNHMRDFGYHYGEYAIAYREDVDNAIFHLHRAFEEFMEDPELAGLVLDKIEIPGVTSLHERGYNIRVLIKTVPGMQWAVQRGFNRLVKQHFARAGIELPYPQTVLHFAQDGQGGVPRAGVPELPGTPRPQAGG